MTFQEEFNKILFDYKISCREVADFLRISITTVYHWRDGTSSPMENMAKLILYQLRNNFENSLD